MIRKINSDSIHSGGGRDGTGAPIRVRLDDVDWDGDRRQWAGPVPPILRTCSLPSLDFRGDGVCRTGSDELFRDGFAERLHPRTTAIVQTSGQCRSFRTPK